MSIQDTLTMTVASQGNGSLSGSVIEVGSTEVKIDTGFAGGSSSVELDVAFTASGTQLFVLVASQNLTILTNSTTSPGNTWNLVAGVPFVWSRSAGYFANPISADVTKFFITCTAASRLQGRVLVA